jgi:hypothetical protein
VPHETPRTSFVFPCPFHDWGYCVAASLRLSLFNGPDLMALPGVKPLMDFVIGVSGSRGGGGGAL